MQRKWRLLSARSVVVIVLLLAAGVAVAAAAAAAETAATAAATAAAASSSSMPDAGDAQLRHLAIVRKEVLRGDMQTSGTACARAAPAAATGIRLGPQRLPSRAARMQARAQPRCVRVETPGGIVHATQRREPEL